MFRLYTIPGSCSTGIHVLLNRLGVPAEITLRDELNDYRELVPTNQVPALQTPQGILTEGAAIVLYLLRQQGQESLASDEEFLRWLMFNYATLHPAYSKLFGVNANMPEGEAKTELLQRFADRVGELWAILDRHLESRSFIVGDEATVLDYLVAIYVRWGNLFPQTRIPVGERVLDLVNRVSALPEFEAAFAREGATYRIPENARAA